MENKCFKGGYDMFQPNPEPEICGKINNELRDRKTISLGDKYGFYNDSYYFIEGGKLHYKPGPPVGYEEVSFEYFKNWLFGSQEITTEQYEIY